MRFSGRSQHDAVPWHILRLGLSAALLLAVLACGTGAENELETTGAGTSPISSSPVSVAQPTVETTETVGESSSTPVQEPDPYPNGNEIYPPSPPEVEAKPKAATETEAEATATTAEATAPPTTTVKELAALVEANPASQAGEPEPTAAVERKRAEGPLAAEPVGIQTWINSAPLTLEQLRGKVVLVDFWTYTCVNCIRTFPYLKLWHSRYADDGLVILGIHTPEFEFEKDYTNVLKATQENGIAWPVAQDNDFETWQAYNNRYWPAKYLIDRDGVIRYTHFGEGKYAETENEIRALLEEAGADLSDDVELPEDQKLDPTYLGTLGGEVTPELYAGYHRNVNAIMTGFRPYVVQPEYYHAVDSVGVLAAPDDLEPHRIFFHGPWEVGSEHVRHGRLTNNYEDYLTLKYSAKSVNTVLTSNSGEPYQVRITLDGENLSEENAGADIRFGQDGETDLQVEQPRLYEIIDSPGYTQGQVLRMSSNSKNFGLFAFTFGVYQEGP